MVEELVSEKDNAVRIATAKRFPQTSTPTSLDDPDNFC